MTDREYRQDDAISQSDIKNYIKSPKIYHYTKILGIRKESTPDMMFGNIVDNLIFDPNFKYKVAEKVDGRTNEGKAYNKQMLEFEDQGFQILKTDEYNKAQEMIACLKANKTSNKYLFESHGEAQSIIFWEHKGVKLKSKLDRLIVDHDKRHITIIDYKTTIKHDSRTFGWSVKDYGYHIQQSFYKEAVKRQYSELFNDPFGENYTLEFIFIPQYKEPPYHIFPIKISDNDELKGYDQWTLALEEISTRTITGNWELDSYYKEDGIENIEVFN